ncbi:hypothetical protein OHC33_009257 [Knufia fluminis]|uniref:EF-hand domain-containing protein n=1 Tax=Knufia fluminis TaxID=191047 RepID=A0AAN8EAZ8_9EURO|nr:hypothetical protein OHC33_009257 [Knufia fluminis]
MFASINVANNGALSLDEYLRWANSSVYGKGKVDEVIAYFHSFDANGDGFVSFNEMHVAAK